MVKKDKKKDTLSKKNYKKEIKRLQGELVKLQLWVKTTGARAIVVFEGRDAAGKGGVIKRITERVSPRIFRVVALPAPTDREKTQIYLQRYITHLLAQFPYEEVPLETVHFGKRKSKGAYDDEASIVDRRWVPEVF